MYQGVVRDEARRASKKKAREEEFEDQARKRAYLQTQQPVSNASSPAPQLREGIALADLKEEDMNFNCKTCER